MDRSRKFFQWGPDNVAFLVINIFHRGPSDLLCVAIGPTATPRMSVPVFLRATIAIAPDKAAYCVFTQFLERENAIKFISVRTKTQ